MTNLDESEEHLLRAIWIHADHHFPSHEDARVGIANVRNYMGDDLWLCRALTLLVHRWFESVFCAYVPPSPEIEAELRDLFRLVLGRLEGATDEVLVRYRQVFAERLETWLEMRPSVSPGPRVRIPPEAAAEMRERVKNLPVMKRRPDGDLEQSS